MAERYGFFNSVNKDRIYDSTDIARFIKKFFTNGVFNNSLKVTSNNNMTISVGIGSANINGYTYENDEVKVLDIEQSDSTLSRIDSVVLRLDLANRNILAQVIQGSYASNPIEPNIVRSANIYDLRLANINVETGSTRITDEMITDTRFSEDCGNVTQAVLELDTNNIFNQYDTKFNNWFNNLVDELSENQATNLQQQITNLLNDVNMDKSYTNTTYDDKNKGYVCDLNRVLNIGEIVQLKVSLNAQNDSTDSEVLISVDNGINFYNLLKKTQNFNLRASDFKYMEIYLKAVFNGTHFVLISPNRVKSIISARIKDSITSTLTTGTITNLDNYNRDGSSLVIENGVIKAKRNMKVKVSATMTLKSNTANVVTWQPYIKKQEAGSTSYENIATARDTCEANNYNTLSITPFIEEIKAGTLFTLGWFKIGNNSIDIVSGQLSEITIEEV